MVIGERMRGRLFWDCGANKILAPSRGGNVSGRSPKHHRWCRRRRRCMGILAEVSID